jgi:hypothetical protein
MKLDLDRLAGFVQSALSVPEVLADARQCGACIELYRPAGPEGLEIVSLSEPI